MKKIKLFVLIVAVIGLALAACGGDDDSHSHTYGNTWSSNETQHWKECSCGDKNGTANHTGNPCTECGYTVSVLNGEVNISGTLTAGNLLTAVYSGNESVTYQWKRGSANVQTGSTFRPLKSGSLTVTVSAAGYASKSATVTVEGSDANMFWWGNYIPETIMNPANLGSAVFNLNELVANVDNARKKYTLPTGYPPLNRNIILNQDGTVFGIYNISGAKQDTLENSKTLGTLDWEEKKSFETAVKGTKSITWNGMGYLYFISPKSFGDVTIQQASIGINGQYTKIEITIDGVEYYVYRSNSSFTTSFTGTQIFTTN